MNKKLAIFLLIGSIIWWVFPDFFPGPIDDFIAFVASVITGINLVATKAKELKDTSDMFLSDSTK